MLLIRGLHAPWLQSACTNWWDPAIQFLLSSGGMVKAQDELCCLEVIRFHLYVNLNYTVSFCARDKRAHLLEIKMEINCVVHNSTSEWIGSWGLSSIIEEKATLVALYSLFSLITVKNHCQGCDRCDPCQMVYLFIFLFYFFTLKVESPFRYEKNNDTQTN